MRFLRISFFPKMGASPMTVVTSEEDLAISIAEADRRQTRSCIDTGGFSISEVFEAEGDLEEVIPKHLNEIDEENEVNQSVLFFWAVEWLPKMRAGGMIMPDPNSDNYPAPLTGDQAESVLEKVALTRQAQARRSVTVRLDCEDGTKLSLLNGRVEKVE